MVWGAISYFGTCELQFLTSRMNAQNYNEVLKTAFPHFQNVFHNLQWHFQHDNAPIHTARSVKSWIQDQKVDLLDWPPYSPDLNIIENVWGWLARKVYESGKQYIQTPLSNSSSSSSLLFLVFSNALCFRCCFVAASGDLAA
ncbi:hypothetical protein ACLKA7_015503 [Drosophila subpalustris]